MTQHNDILRHQTFIAEKRIRVARRLQAQEALRVSIELTRSIKKRILSRLAALAYGNFRKS